MNTKSCRNMSLHFQGMKTAGKGVREYGKNIKETVSGKRGRDTPASTSRVQKNRQYKAGIYARLSADIDKKVCRQTSKNESVEVQIEIAKKFIEEWNGKHTDKIEVVDCYIDLGKTGNQF